jgi:hypothetical protein
MILIATNTKSLVLNRSGFEPMIYHIRDICSQKKKTLRGMTLQLIGKKIACLSGLVSELAL